MGKHLTFAQGSAIGVGYRTAYRALFERAQIESGERILIRGASGGVGLPCIEMAKLHGCFVVATSSSSLGQDQCRIKGADVVMSHSIDVETIQRLMDDSLFDVIIEMLANKNLDSDLKLLSRGGRVVIVGNKGNIKINPRDLMMKETSIIGMLGGPKNNAEFRRYRGYLNTNILNGRFIPTVNLSLPLEKAPESHLEVIRSLGLILMFPLLPTMTTRPPRDKSLRSESKFLLASISMITSNKESSINF
jgi:NADPH2:quinone reductase